MTPNEVVRARADQLGLKDWTFEVGTDPAPYYASCTCTVGRKFAKLDFPSEWDWTNLGISERQTITHELLHCHFDNWQSVVHQFRETMSPRENDILEASLRLIMEFGIDGIADAIVAIEENLDGKRKVEGQNIYAG